MGWFSGRTLNPTLTFFFAGGPTINSIDIHLDNSGAGGVFSPQAILIDGISQAFTGPSLGSIGIASITGLNLTGGSHAIQFQQPAGATWTFASEISVFGIAAVPEPATWALMIGGFAMAGGVLRRRRARLA